MSQLQINHTILEQRFPHVATKINSLLNDDLSIPLFTEPFERDIAWLNAVDGSIGNGKIIFVYGFERGLSIADLLELYPNHWLFVYEPDEQLFRKSVTDYDLSLLLGHPNLYWLSVGQSQLNMMFHMLSSYMLEDLGFIALRKYLSEDMNLLREVKEQFQEYRQSFLVDKHTENRFREEWTRNFLYHLSDVLYTPSIERLFYAFEGATVVVVSSGPSLQEDIEWLKKLRPHVLIISAGSSIQALVKHGIQPHLAVIMDGHPVNKKIFSSSVTREQPLLFTSSSYYEISDQHCAEKIHSIMKSDAVSQYFFGLSKEELFISPTETVAGTAIQAAACLGAKRIILAGQDLSFPDNKFYADGIEHFAAEATDKTVQEAPKKVLNVKGTYNTTDESFSLMKDGLENLITVLPRIEFVNSSRNGAVIEGAPFKPMEEMYKLLASESINPDAIADLINEKNVAVDMNKVQDVRDKLIATREDLSNVRSEIAAIHKLMNKLREFSRTKPAKAQNMMECIEQMWGLIANRNWFSPIFESIMPIEIARFDQLLPVIVTEHQLTRKSDLIYEHLGKLLQDITAQIPILQEMFSESICRLDKKTDRDAVVHKNI
ncbi:motility associated factor glycosyltransferase family protein [Paenibacillus sp. SEL1]|uniref:motility associated factor glycosyltransferase family protein n=1 Tax=Paenibacillus polymyxa TaxID=1406 RepID=UPI002AB52C60|nr:6-hydroxymethylpterin diphosphokinase MptE-like protein [Paenibacillus polymyxa]MDY8044718.1 6-hydroxymethylpterin diphosphokinase MptE-like protein [Paenibacillus polymyxa]